MLAQPNSDEVAAPHDGKIVREIASVVRVLARKADDNWARSVSFALAPDLESVGAQRLQAVLLPCRVTMPGELVQVYFDLDDSMATACSSGEIERLLLLGIGPVIEGVGEIVLQKTPKGFIILRLSMNGRNISAMNSAPDRVVTLG